MLGELIYQGSGKRIVRRVLSSEPVKVEVTFEGPGKVLGIDAMEIGTYTSVIRSDGTIYGEGAGVLMTTAGDSITWKGAGVGTFKERGAVSYRGAVSTRPPLRSCPVSTPWPAFSNSSPTKAVILSPKFGSGSSPRVGIADTCVNGGPHERASVCVVPALRI